MKNQVSESSDGHSVIVSFKIDTEHLQNKKIQELYRQLSISDKNKDRARIIYEIADQIENNNKK